MYKTGPVEGCLAACALCSQGQLERENKLVSVVADLADETAACADGAAKAVSLTVFLQASQLGQQGALACLLQLLQGVQVWLSG